MRPPRLGLHAGGVHSRSNKAVKVSRASNGAARHRLERLSSGAMFRASGTKAVKRVVERGNGRDAARVTHAPRVRRRASWLTHLELII